MEKGAEEWTSGRRDDGGKNGGRAANPNGTATRTRETLEAKEKARAKGKGKSETRYCHECGGQGHIGVNCPFEWTNNIDEEDE